jgi:hypothetical protein
MGAVGSMPGGIWGGTQKRTGLVTREDVSTGRKAGKGMMSGFTGTRKWEAEGKVMDPAQMAAAITAQPAFGAVSGMVAEANQLMNREGPMWNELNNSVVGSVYEGAAALQRQQMEEISRMQAAGGNARHAGLAMAQRFQVQENVNRQRTSQLWQSRMALEQYRTQAAQRNISYAQAWVDNQSGIRDSFTAALTNLRTFWSQTIPGVAIPASARATAATQQATQAGYQGLMEATQARGNAIGGAIEGLTGTLSSVNWGDVTAGIQGVFTKEATTEQALGEFAPWN